MLSKVNKLSNKIHKYAKLACHPRLAARSCAKGFTLIESMMTSGIIAVGFVGVFSLVAASEQFTQRAIDRQKLQMIADQMLEIIETDLANINSYGMDLSTCTTPTTSNQWEVRGFEWCTRMEDEMGAAGSTNTRTITITVLSGDRTLVSILLGAQNQTVFVTMRRVFDV